MLYMGNPTGNQAIRQAMIDGIIGWMDTPRQRNIRPVGVTWCADNGCYPGSGRWTGSSSSRPNGSSRFDETYWWEFLQRHVGDTTTCLFATAPDVVGDAAATLKRSAPWLPKIRELGYRVAFVAQDGQERLPIPWDEFDVLFIGGGTEWKLGPEPRALCAQAHDRGKRVHFGRVNSGKRYRYGRDVLGAQSGDGTFLRFAPTENLDRMMRWFQP